MEISRFVLAHHGGARKERLESEEGTSLALPSTSSLALNLIIPCLFARPLSVHTISQVQTGIQRVESHRLCDKFDSRHALFYINAIPHQHRRLLVTVYRKIQWQTLRMPTAEAVQVHANSPSSTRADLQRLTHNKATAHPPRLSSNLPT
jgi:hypothetical protein